MRTRKPHEENFPLLLVFDEGVDQSRFFVQFMSYHDSISETAGREYFLPVLGSLGSPFNRPGFALYSVVNRLREVFNIRQRVSQNESELRKFFGYWLGLANDKLDQWVTVEKDVVLFFESVDKMKDKEMVKNSILSNWLPKTYPPRVKCVLTCAKSSNVERIITRMQYKRIEVRSVPGAVREFVGPFLTPEHTIKMTAEAVPPIVFDFGKREKEKKRVGKKDEMDREDVSDSRVFNNKLVEVFNSLPQGLSGSLPFAEVFFGFFSLQNYTTATGILARANQVRIKETSFGALSRIREFVGALDCLVSIFSSDLNFEEKDQVVPINPKRALLYTDSKVDRFVELMKYLATTSKGLSASELERLTNLNPDSTRLSLLILSPVLVSVDDLHRFYNEEVAGYVRQTWIKGTVVGLQKSIGQVLTSSPNSVRKLEEQILNLYEAKEWFQLKQVISAVENFLILFNPIHKYLLSTCWGGLVRQNYDPVIEYNKAVELFEMHYQPSIADLFRVVLQLSRFFKELVDFEGEGLPEFRHPLVRNRLLTLDQELVEKSGGSGLGVEGREEWEDSRVEAEEFSIDSADSEREEHLHGRCKNHLEDIGLLREVKRMGLYDRGNKCEVLAAHEKANVDIPAGLEEYLTVYRQMVRDKTEKKMSHERMADELGDDPEAWQGLGIGLKNLLNDKKKFELESWFESKTRGEQKSSYLVNLEGSRPKEAEGSRPKEAEKEGEEKRGPKSLEEGRQYYFYKRWMWIMFPWACMSIEKDGVYSDQIHRCFESDLKYIKVVDELELTQRAQLIAIEAKEKKKAVLEETHGDYLIHEDLKEVHSRMGRTGQNPPADKDRSRTSDRSTVPGGGFGVTRKNTASNLKRIGAAREGRKSTADVSQNLDFLSATGGLQMGARGGFTRSSFDLERQKPAVVNPISASPSLAHIPASTLYLTAVQGGGSQLGRGKSNRSLLSEQNNQQKRNERLGIGYSELDFKNMGNVCHTNIKKTVEWNDRGIKNMFGVQRMMREVRDILETRSTKELAFMDSKNTKMASALNQLIYENSQALRKLESLRNELKKDGTSFIRENNLEKKISVR